MENTKGAVLIPDRAYQLQAASIKPQATKLKIMIDIRDYIGYKIKSAFMRSSMRATSKPLAYQLTPTLNENGAAKGRVLPVPGRKLQATSNKPQASSYKRLNKL